MSLTNKRKLQWQCRRGMLEVELLLNDFLRFDYDALSAEKKQRFEDLLLIVDPLLFDYFTGLDEPQDDGLRDMVLTIRNASGKRSVG